MITRLATRHETVGNVTYLFPVDLGGSNARHPSNPQPRSDRQDLIDAGIVSAPKPNELTNAVRESAQNTLSSEVTRKGEGSFQVGRLTPLPRSIFQ